MAIFPIFNETLVNAPNGTTQDDPTIAIDADGDFVVIWESLLQDDPSAPEGKQVGVYGQRFDETGAKLGGEFRVNTVTTDNQSRPSVAMEADGDFTVVWDSYDQEGVSLGFYGVYSKRYTSAGVALTGDTLVNTTTDRAQRDPVIGADSAGNYVVVWRGKGPGDRNGVFFQRFNNAGERLGGEVLVNSPTDDPVSLVLETDPAVAVNDSGTFVVTYTIANGFDDNVYARVFNSAGTPLTAPLLVNVNTVSAQNASTVAIDNAGNFVVVWETLAADGTNIDLVGRRFSSTGAPLSAEFQISTVTAGNQSRAAIGIDANGNFTVTWQSQQDGSGNGIYARQFTSNGTPVSPEFLVNQTTAGEQFAPSIAVQDNGDLAIAWSSQHTGNGDVYVRKYYFNDAPTDLSASATSINENVPNNSVIGTLSTVDPDIPYDQFTYSLVAGTGSTDNAAFNIFNNQLRITNSPNFEAKNSYNIRVRTTDRGGLFTEKALTITINNVNETPTALALSNTSVNENVAPNTTVGTFTTTDPDTLTPNTFTYSLVSGIGSTDNAAFTIAGNELKVVNSPDFENKPSYTVRVRTTDQGGLSTERAFTINVNNLNEAPTALALSATSINENVPPNTTVGTFTTTDPDTGNTFTYSLVPGTGADDNAAFTIAGNELKIVNSPDFESKSSYTVRVRTTDQGNLSTEQTFTITVNDISEQNIINGTAGRDTLTGAEKDDVITGFQGADTITTGTGKDSIVYTNTRDAGDTITDFAVGSDKIVLTQLLDSIVAGGYNGTDAIADGYIRVRDITPSGSSTSQFSVDLDTDGSVGSNVFRSFITVQGAGLTLSNLNNPSNFVF